MTVKGAGLNKRYIKFMVRVPTISRLSPNGLSEYKHRHIFHWNYLTPGKIP